MNQPETDLLIGIPIRITRLDDHDRRIQTLEDQVRGLTDRLTTAEQREATDIGNIGTVVASNRQTISDLQAQIQGLQGQVVSQDTVDALNAAVTTLETNNAQLESIAPAPTP